MNVIVKVVHQKRIVDQVQSQSIHQIIIVIEVLNIDEDHHHHQHVQMAIIIIRHPMKMMTINIKN
jgi:hypothetical protein